MPPTGKGGLKAALVDFSVPNEAAQAYAAGVLFMTQPRLPMLRLVNVLR